MRTTLTLDDDVAAKLKAETRKSGRPFREVVNEVLRFGFAARAAPPPREAFRLPVRDLGKLQPGLTLDSVADVLEQIDRPLHR